jgi:hypothetical protein
VEDTGFKLSFTKSQGKAAQVSTAPRDQQACVYLPGAIRQNESLQPGLAAAIVSMRLFVAFGAQGDQVLFLVTTRMASEFEVLHL